VVVVAEEHRASASENVLLPACFQTERSATDRRSQQKIRARILRLFQPRERPRRFPLETRGNERDRGRRNPTSRHGASARGCAGVGGAVGDLDLAGEPLGAGVRAGEQALLELAPRDAVVRDAAKPAGAVRVGRAALAVPRQLARIRSAGMRPLVAGVFFLRRCGRLIRSRRSLDGERRWLRPDRAVVPGASADGQGRGGGQRGADHALSAAFSYTMSGASFLRMASSLMTISRMFLCEGTSYMMFSIAFSRMARRPRAPLLCWMA